MSDSQDVNVTSIIDESRFAGYQLADPDALRAHCGFDGYDTQGIAYVAPAIVKDLGIAPTALGLIFSSGLVGLTLGALGFGVFADKFGRKQAMIWSVVLFGIFSLATPRTRRAKPDAAALLGRHRSRRRAPQRRRADDGIHPRAAARPRR